MKKRLLILLIIITGFFAILFTATMYPIYSSVKRICIKAKSEFNTDCTQALILYIQSEKHSFREKNEAMSRLNRLGK